MVAVVAHCFTLVNPAETLKVFLPYLFDSIEEALHENPHISKDEHVDAKFLFNLLILSEVSGFVVIFGYFIYLFIHSRYAILQ